MLPQLTFDRFDEANEALYNKDQKDNDIMKYYSSNGRSSGLGANSKNYEDEEDDDFEDLEDFERDGFSLSIQEFQTELNTKSSKSLPEYDYSFESGPSTP